MSSINEEEKECHTSGESSNSNHTPNPQGGLTPSGEEIQGDPYYRENLNFLCKTFQNIDNEVIEDGKITFRFILFIFSLGLVSEL